ncbi:MAG: hypothetical protein U0230_04185 [Polyangiales bacterium]
MGSESTVGRKSRRRLGASRLALAVVLVLVPAGGAPAQGQGHGRRRPAADAGAPVGLDAAVPTYVPATAEQLADLEAQLAAMRTLARGELPTGFALPQLARIGAANQSWIDSRILQLEAWLANPVGRPPPPPGAQVQATPFDDEPVDPRVRALDLEITRARLEALRLPAATRALLLAQDAQRQQMEQLRESIRSTEAAARSEAARATAREQAALDEMDGARTAAERFLATEEARAEGTRRQQAELEVTIARQRLSLHDERVMVADQALERRVHAVAGGSSQASGLYAELVRNLRRAEAALRRGLAAADRSVTVPRYTLPRTLPAVPSLAPRVRALRTRARTLDAAGRELERRARELDSDRLSSGLQRMRHLDNLRFELLRKLSVRERDALLGFGPEGRAQLKREIGRLDLTLRIYARERRMLFRRDSGAAVIRRWVQQTRLRLVGSLFVAMFFGLASLFVHPMLERSRRALEKWRPTLSTRGGLALVGALHRIRHGLLLFLLVRSLLVLWPLALLPVEVQIMGTLLALYAVYAMVMGATQGLVEWASAIDGIPLRTDQVEKVRRTLVLLGRYGLFLSSFLSIAVRILGEGAVYHQVSRLAWLGLVPITISWVNTWEPETRAAMAARFPRADWARALDVPRGKAGWRLALLASSAVALGSSFAGALVRFAMQFESTRSAQAFVLRRKLERRGKVAASGPVELPESVVRAFSEEPVDSDASIVDRLPDLDGFVADLGRFQEGGASPGALVIGESGHGKSTWILAACRRAREKGLRTFLLRPEVRLHEAEEVDAFLARGLGLAAVPQDAQAWRQAFRGIGPCLVAIDDVHLIFRRGIDRRAPFRRLVQRLSDASGSVGLVVTVARHAYDYLAFAERGPHPVFHRTIRLGRWHEEEIRTLLDRRIELAAVPIRFDLLVEGDEATGTPDLVLRTKEELVRLVWDYAAGSPRLAIQSFRAALRPGEEGTLSVALFPRVDATRLDALTPRQAWVLAAIVWQGGATTDEVAEILRGDPLFALETLRFLASFGAVEEVAGRGYVVTTPWTLAARRRLERDHLLLD